MNESIYTDFIESWGSMGGLWGINRSMARIHAFIVLSEKAVDLDIISNELQISRGNASMSLKELRNWGVIKKVNIAGDRRDFYTAEPDSWRMFFRIATERKKREFDPMLNSLRHLLSEADIEDKPEVNNRLMQIETTLSTIDRVMNKFLESEKLSKVMIEFFKNFTQK